MNQTQIYNSDFKQTSGGVSPFSRAFLFGESIFTTIRFSGGRALFLDDHLRRLEKGFYWLFGETNLFPSDDLREGLKKLAMIHPEARSRVTFHLDNNRYEFIPSDGAPDFFIMLSELDDAFLEAVPTISLGVSEEPFSRGVPHFAKVGQYLHQVKKIRKFREKKYDDVLFFDDLGKLTEASTSNIFFRKGDRFMTPLLNDGLLDGIMRKNLILFMQNADWNLTEGCFNIDNLLDSDEVWLSNSSGLRWVGNVDGKSFEKSDWTQRLRLLVLEGVKDEENSKSEMSSL